MPQIGSEVSVSVAVDIGFFAAGVKIVGRFLTTQFPVVVEVLFHKFPIEIR